MITTDCNKELTFSLPDAFADCSAEDLKLGADSSDNNLKAMRDTGRHIVFIVRWQKYNALALKLADSRSMIKNNEKRTAKVYEAADADYRLLEFFTADVGGKEAEGYRYSYHVEGIEQDVDTVLVKTKNYVYNVSFYYRAENSEADRELIGSVLKTTVIGR